MPSEFGTENYTTTIASFQQNSILLNLIKSYIFKLVKCCLHLFTRKSAVERLLSKYDYNGGTSASIDKQSEYATLLYNALAGSKFESLREASIYLDGNRDCNYRQISEIATTIDRLKLSHSNKSIRHVESRRQGSSSEVTSKSNTIQSSISTQSYLTKNDKDCILTSNSLPPAINISSKKIQNLTHLLKICSTFGSFKNIIKQLRDERYDSNNNFHETSLLQIWSNLKDEPLESRKSEQWKQLGFQGKDPKTDFRGMGRLALEAILKFSQDTRAKNFILKASHPVTGWSFGILGINITQLLVDLIESGNGKIRNYIYKKFLEMEVLECGDLEKTCLDIFCSLFIEVLMDFKTNYWQISSQADIMNFNQVRMEYKHEISCVGRPEIGFC